MSPPDSTRAQRFTPDLLEDADALAVAVAHRVAEVEEGLGDAVARDAALEVVCEHDPDGRDALGLALELIEERCHEVVVAIARAAIEETVIALRDPEGTLRDEQRRAWWLDRVLREAPEVQRLGVRLRRREDDLRRAMGDELWRSLFLPIEALINEQAAAGQDAIVLALLRGHPAPERGRR